MIKSWYNPKGQSQPQNALPKTRDIPINNANWDQQPVTPSMKKVTEWFAHMVFEYRWQKPEGGLMAKAGWSPLFFAKMENFKYQKKT